MKFSKKTSVIISRIFMASSALCFVAAYQGPRKFHAYFAPWFDSLLNPTAVALLLMGCAVASLTLFEFLKRERRNEPECWQSGGFNRFLPHGTPARRVIDVAVWFQDLASSGCHINGSPVQAAGLSEVTFLFLVGPGASIERRFMAEGLLSAVKLKIDSQLKGQFEHSVNSLCRQAGISAVVKRLDDQKAHQLWIAGEASFGLSKNDLLKGDAHG